MGFGDFMSRKHDHGRYLFLEELEKDWLGRKTETLLTTSLQGARCILFVRNADVVDVGIVEARSLVSKTGRSRDFSEYGPIDGWEKDICIKIAIDHGHIKAIGKRKKLFVKVCATHNEGGFVESDYIKERGEGMSDLYPIVMEFGVGSEDDIATFGERFFGQRIEGAASHDDGMSRG